MKLINDNDSLGTIIFGLFSMVVIIFMIVASAWLFAIKPILIRFDLIDYKPTDLIRYESFLEKTIMCKEKERVDSKKNYGFPEYQIFICENGVELIWKYKLKNISKIDSEKWLLD